MNYFDLHCDTIAVCEENNVGIKSNEFQVSLEKGKEIDKWIQTYAIWIPDELRGEYAYAYFNRVYNYFINELEKNKSEIALCTNYNDIETTLSKGKRVALLAIEGSAALGGNIDRIKEFKDKGVCMMTLTWNGKAEVGDGCMVEDAGGLTEFGKKVIREMNKCNMIIDISHLAPRGVQDIIQNTTTSFIATHSNSYEICSHPRNLSDEYFKQIIDRGGIVGINFYPMFINGTDSAYKNEMFHHISHFISLGGENHICLGSDFDGASMPIDLQNIEGVVALYNDVKYQYGEIIADKIFFNNAINFMKNNLI